MNNLQSYLDSAKDYFRKDDEFRLGFLNCLHYEHNYSMQEIAGLIGTYLNRVLRDAKRLNFQKRSKSEIQRIALAEGKREHPTKGKKRDEKTKIAISESMGKNWDSLSKEERDERSKQSKEHWEKLDSNKKTEIRRKAGEAIRQSSREGSKLEKFLLEALTKEGFSILYHQEHVLINEKMHFDMYIPSISTVVEIDGPSHFEPIWGHDVLQRNQKSDNQKTGQCLALGLWVVRIKQNKRISERYKRNVLEALVTTLNKIKNKQIEKIRENMVINIEV